MTTGASTARAAASLAALVLVSCLAGAAVAQSPADRLGEVLHPPARTAAEAEPEREATGPELADFLTPDPIGFDLTTLEALADGVERAGAHVAEALESFQRASLIEKLKMSAPVQLVVIFLVGFWVLDRRARHLRRELWDLLPPLATPLLDNVLDSALRILARALPVTVVLIPLYFPLKGIFPQATWLIVLTHCLWVVLTYRVVHASVNEALIGEVFGFEQKPVRLQRWFQTGLRVVLVLWLVKEIVGQLDYRDDVVALLTFSIKAFVAVWALRLFTLGDDLVLLFPEFPDSPLYSSIRAVLVHYVHGINGLSLLLLVLWAAGFGTAARFILVRTYALLGAVLGGLWLYRRLQGALRSFIDNQTSPDGEPADAERLRVLRSLERSLMLVGSMALLWGVLNIIGLWDTAVSVASIPILQPSANITISVFVVAKAASILYLFILASRIVRAVLSEKLYPKFEVDVGVGYAINTMAHYFLFVTGAFLGLKSIGLDLSAVAIFFSALGLGIGFGLQSIVNNLISGFILLFGRSVKKGDWVTAGNTYGRVDSVGARSVTIWTPDHYEIVIPSSEIVSNSIINWTLSSPTIRVSVPVGVSYTSDIALTMRVLLECARKNPRVLGKPKPEVWIEGFGDSSVDLVLLLFIDCRYTNERRIRGELNLIIWNALAENGIEIPFPQRDLHLKTGFDMSRMERVLTQYLEARREAEAGWVLPAESGDSEAPPHPDEPTDTSRRARPRKT